MNDGVLRIIDANLNRAREGLRVCEDIARFSLADNDMARSLKVIRHASTKAVLSSNRVSLKRLLRNRDVKRDGLKFADFKKQKGSDIFDIFWSNIERAKESLRVLEECCKIVDENASRKYRKLRFDLYDIEKRSFGKTGHLSNSRYADTGR